ncbi:unnamed protein product [Phaedon cochleariae]|uniref:MICAL-like protein 1 n=1 Tax=Phaedon cochleariae TaxID=80249 RepID=A0A9P0DR36_PHACE|nr:unnamed protein product [Phaedon cochleariae]
MSERKGTKGLELWCRKMTEGYPGVKIDNMTTSWRDGLAFCAIIHHFRPDLIDFAKLNKDDVYHNNELAFRVAEQYLGIPALLEPEDMVEYSVPDRLSILTYLSQFYQTFAVRQGSSPARVAPKRPQTSPDHGIVSPASTSPPTKVALTSVGRVRREPCAKCGLPVFLAERLNVGKLLFHRTCFRCARCDSPLTLANYYETENAEYCCEICPDEDKVVSKDPNEKSLLQKSLSDEEKSASLSTFSNEPDAFSTDFETALDSIENLSKNTEFTQARSRFFQTQFETSDSGQEEEKPPDIPKTLPPKLDESEKIEPALKTVHSDSGFPNLVNSSDKISDSNHGSSSIELRKSRNIVTKDEPHEVDTSLVKARMRLFENNNVKSDVNRVSLSSEVPKAKSPSTTIPIVRIEELENFDDGSCDRKVNNNTNQDIDSPSNKSTLKHSMNGDVSLEEPSIAHIAQGSSVEDIKGEIIQDISEAGVKEEDERNVVENIVSKERPHLNSNEIIELKEDTHNIEEDLAPDKLPHENSTDKFIELSNDNINVCDINETKDFFSTPYTTPNTSDEVIVISDDSPILIEDSPVVDQQISVVDEAEESFQTNSEINHSVESKVDSLLTSDVKSSEHSTADEYPDDLNPFGDDDEQKSQQQSLNPFGSDSEEENSVPLRPVASPRLKKKIQPHSFDKEHLNSLRIERVSVNPFGSDDEDGGMVEMKPPKPVARHKKVISAPKISLNPFWSDEENEEPEKQPVPKPRTSRTSVGAPEPRPRDAGGYSSLTTKTNFGSNSSISSGSAYGSARKKKPAPRPPIPTRFDDSGPGSLTSSPSHSLHPSPRSTPRSVPKKRAPPPPTFSSTPDPSSRGLPKLAVVPSPIELEDPSLSDPVRGDVSSVEKLVKDEANRNKQNVQRNSPPDGSPILSTPNKSTYGRWKRRKGQAPPKPIPQKRTIKVLPMAEIRRELDLIEAQQQGLEKQGVRLEQIIREKCEGEGDDIIDNDIPIDVEDLILQLFELVNEKNELFRKQTELMYIRRQQRLEEEHADVEYQIRCLMLQPEANKTDSDKAREEELIKRLIDIVERRNEIVECLEMDRVREAEEDDSINIHINLFTSNRDGEKTVPEDSQVEIDKDNKEKKKHKKDKKFKIKSKSKIDMDKDVDESESFSTLEKKKKKKFNLF